MQSTKLLLALICIFANISSLNGMKKPAKPTSPIKRGRESSDLIDLTNLFLQSPEKKAQPHQTSISRTVKHLTWQEALIAETQLPTLTPQEHDETVIVEVDPLVEAVYYDNVTKLKHILETETPDLLLYTYNIINSLEAATILDIAAERLSYKCLEYLESILYISEPKLSLQALACKAIVAQDNFKLHSKAQRCCPDLDIDNCAAQATNFHLYNRISPQLLQLYATAYHSSIRIARKHSDIHCARLIQDGFNRTK